MGGPATRRREALPARPAQHTPTAPTDRRPRRSRRRKSAWRDLALEVVAWLAALIIRVHMLTVRLYADRRVLPGRFRPREPVIVAFWHGHLLGPLLVCRNVPARVLVSRSRDGERVARVAKWFGFGAVRGSTSRGAAGAMKELLDVAAQGDCHLAITPDGPRGPVHRVAPGIVYLAQKTGFPIVPLALGFDRYWLPPSKWDEFLIPKPLARGLLRMGEWFRVPPEATPAELQHLRRELEEYLRAFTLSVYAEAATGDLDNDPTVGVAH